MPETLQMLFFVFHHSLSYSNSDSIVISKFMMIHSQCKKYDSISHKTSRYVGYHWPLVKYERFLVVRFHCGHTSVKYEVALSAFSQHFDVK